MSRRSISRAKRLRILMRDGHRCRYCGAGVADGAVLELDHITPVARGGSNDESNLVAACQACNRGKGDRDMFVSRKKHDDLLKFVVEMTWCDVIEAIARAVCTTHVGLGEADEESVGAFLHKAIDGGADLGDLITSLIGLKRDGEMQWDGFREHWTIILARRAKRG